MWLKIFGYGWNGKNYQKEWTLCYVPLPFCDQELLMPNKQQAVKRLMGPKRRFIKDDKFFLDYKKYMNDLLKKGYARRCNETPTRKTWYFPHHTVYHPSKPGKICVVYVCSAESEGKSTNKELLPGPDLTNQIVSILIRFWKGSCHGCCGINVLSSLSPRKSNLFEVSCGRETTTLNVTHKSLSCVPMCLVAFLLEA